MKIMVNIADLTDPNDPAGRSYREVNAANAHAIPIGALVEIETGARLFVVAHNRDCDQTPLYALAADPNDTEVERQGFANHTWLHGYSEECLTVLA